jgi:tetratricopeptide (TPR) repeat protein
MSVAAGERRPSPRSVLAAACGVLVILGFVAAENLVSQRLDALFLSYPGIDKVGHAVQYSAIFVAIWLLCGRVTADRVRRGALAAALTMSVGLADESVQRHVARRTFELADLFVDGCGALIGLAWVERRRAPRALVAGLLVAATAGTTAMAVRSYGMLKDYRDGVRYERARDYVQARASYQRALQAGAPSPNLYNALAWVEVESGVGDPAKAVEYGAVALARRPTNPDVLDTYGWALHFAGRDAEALPYLQRAAAARPRMYCIHLHLGAVYRALGRHSEARRHLELQIRGLPGSPEAQRAAALLATLPAPSHETP